MLNVVYVGAHSLCALNLCAMGCYLQKETPMAIKQEFWGLGPGSVIGPV